MRSPTLARRASLVHCVAIGLGLAAAAIAAPRAAPPAAVDPPRYPLLWRIEGEHPSYLFGTIHIADRRVTTLGPEVEAALDSTGALFTELPFDQMNLGALTGRMMLPRGETLEGVLPKALYDRAARALRSRGMELAAFKRFQPWALTMILGTLDFMKQMKGEALDMQLYDEALVLGKATGGLETIDEQIDVFAGFDREDQFALLAHALEGVERGDDSSEDLLDAYLSGDTESLEASLADELAPDDPLLRKFGNALLDDRNARMAERIDALLKEHPDRGTFVAVGAAHMPGEHGLVELLRARGWRVARVKPPPSRLELNREIRSLRDRNRALERELFDLRRRLGIPVPASGRTERRV